MIFTIVNMTTNGISFEVEADDPEEAAFDALSSLGWAICSEEEFSVPEAAFLAPLAEA